eukprot:866144-Rhodomonas_salina.3
MPAMLSAASTVSNWLYPDAQKRPNVPLATRWNTDCGRHQTAAERMQCTLNRRSASVLVSYLVGRHRDAVEQDDGRKEVIEPPVVDLETRQNILCQLRTVQRNLKRVLDDSKGGDATSLSAYTWSSSSSALWSTSTDCSRFTRAIGVSFGVRCPLAINDVLWLEDARVGLAGSDSMLISEIDLRCVRTGHDLSRCTDNAIGMSDLDVAYRARKTTATGTWRLPGRWTESRRHTSGGCMCVRIASTVMSRNGTSASKTGGRSDLADAFEGVGDNSDEETGTAVHT